MINEYSIVALRSVIWIMNLSSLTVHISWHEVWSFILVSLREGENNRKIKKCDRLHGGLKKSHNNFWILNDIILCTKTQIQRTILWFCEIRIFKHISVYYFLQRKKTVEKKCNDCPCLIHSACKIRFLSCCEADHMRLKLLKP